MAAHLASVRTAGACCAAILLACLILAAESGTAAADCVRGIALCAMECDQRTKPTTAERPQCARTCVSNYQRCERTDVLQSTTGGGAILNQGMTLVPAR